MTERNQKLEQMKAAVEDVGGTGVLQHIQIKIVAAGKFLTLDNSGLGGTSEDVTALLEELFATVRQLEKEINTTIAAQPGLMKKVLDENTRFVEARSADTVTVTRSVIQSLGHSVARSVSWSVRQLIKRRKILRASLEYNVAAFVKTPIIFPFCLVLLFLSLSNYAAIQSKERES